LEVVLVLALAPLEVLLGLDLLFLLFERSQLDVVMLLFGLAEGD
jgi:hypothetical protein